MNWDGVLDPATTVWWGQTESLSKRLEADTLLVKRLAVALGCFAENTTCHRIDEDKGNNLMRSCQDNVIPD